MKILRMYLLVLLCSFLLFQQTSAANTDLSPYISKLEEAADVCDNSMFSTSQCTKICTNSAEQFKQAKTFSGIRGEMKNALTKCMTAMAANDDGRSSPLFNQIGALQATLSTELFKLKMASYGQQALAKAKAPPAQAVPQQVSVDSNIYDSNGQVDSNKIPVLYDGLSQNCQNLSSDMMKKLCSKMCQSAKKDVVRLLDTIKQAPKNISAADKERNTYNLLHTIETDLNFSCAKQFKAMPVAQQPSSYLALVDFVGAIKKGAWPPKPALSLELAMEEPAPELKQAEQLVSVTDAKALNTFDFSQAVSVIKSMPDYQALAQAVQGIPYSVKQMSSSLAALIAKESSYLNQKQQWQDKVQQLGMAGRRKELFEALNSQCDMAYLQTFNKPSNWHVNKVDTRQDMYGNAKKAPFEQLLSPAHLHRFCYQELASRLNPQYAQKNSRSELQILAENYISHAPVNPYKAVARDSEPARVMSEEDWLPAWHAYAQTRRAEFDSRQVNDKNSQLYAQLLNNENFEAWLDSNQQETRDGLKFFQATAQSANYQLQLASADKYRLIQSSFHGADNVYGQYPKINNSPKPGRNKQPNYIQVKILDMLQCTQAPALWQQFSQDPLAADYKQLNKTALALSACYRKVWKADRVFDFEDFKTAKNMGGQVERQVRERGELELKIYAPIAREQMKLTGFNYAELHAANLITHELERLKARFRDTLNGDVTAGSEDFSRLVGIQYQRITGIGLDEKDKAQDMLAKHNQKLKQQALLNKVNGSKQQDNIFAQLAVSGSAMKMQYYGRCIKNIENLYYNCECLADAYVKQKSDNPQFSDYKFGQGSAYGQCYDAQATEKTETQACASLQLPIYDCNCHGKTYVKMLQKAGIRRPTDRQAKDLKSKALSACQVDPKSLVKSAK